MKHIPLFKDTKNHYFLVSKDPVRCESCSRPMNSIAYIRTVWGQKSDIYSLCQKCINIPFFNSIVNEYKVCQIVPISKPGFVPIIITNPQIRTATDISVFDTNKIKSDRIKDKTKLSGRESFENVQIGFVDNDLLEYKDRSLHEEEVKEKVLELENAKCESKFTSLQRSDYESARAKISRPERLIEKSNG